MSAKRKNVVMPSQAASEEAVDRFIETGEGSEPPPEAQSSESKRLCSVRFSPAILSEIDARAKELGMTRSAFINAAVAVAIRDGLQLIKN